MGNCGSSSDKQQQQQGMVMQGYDHPKEPFQNTHPACCFAYCVESKHDFETTCTELEAAVKRNKFGVLGTHKINEVLKNKGFELENNNKAHVYEVCNPSKAQQVLNTEMLMSLALPCRISVFTQNGKIFVAQMAPISLMSVMFNIPEDKKQHMNTVAGDVTSITETIIKQCCGVVEIPQEQQQ